MEITSNNPYKDQQNQLSSNDKTKKDLKKYAGTVKKFDKNILNNIVDREMRLKKVDPELASKIADENKDSERNENRVESIENYFLNKQKFDSFRNNISETIKSTIDAQPDIKKNNTKFFMLKGVNTGLESTEKNQGSKYWRYMGLQFVKGNLENEIIGREGTKNITERIQNSLTSIANNFSPPENLEESENDNENYDNENNSSDNESSTTDASSTPSKPTNKYLNLDARDLTEAIKNMSKNYNEKLLKAQDEINTACMEQLKSVRENAKRFFNYTLPENKNTENGYLITLDKIVDNKKKLYPIAPVTSTNEESNKATEPPPLKPSETGATDLPAVFKPGTTTNAPVAGATSKPNRAPLPPPPPQTTNKILPPPTTPPQTINKLPPPPLPSQPVNTLPPPPTVSAPSAVTGTTVGSTKLPSYAPESAVSTNTVKPTIQTLAPPPAITSPVSNSVEQNSTVVNVVPPAGSPTAAGTSEPAVVNTAADNKQASEALQTVLNNTTIPAANNVTATSLNTTNNPIQQPKGQNAATGQGTATPAPKQTDNKSTTANNPAPKKSYKPLTKRDLITAENEIIAQYNQQFKDTYDELIKEFQKNQSDAFAALSKISNFDSDEKSMKNFEKCKDNLSNAEDSMYNFNLSLGNFLNMLAQKMPKAPTEKENKNEGAEQNNKTPQNEQQASQEVKNAEKKLDQKIEEVKEATSEESAPQIDYDDDNVIDVFDMAGAQDTIGTTLRNFFKEDKPEKDFQDILTGKMYQSDFLENVVDCLMTLLRYMPENTDKSSNGNAFNKKGDDTFSRQDIRDLIAAAQPTAESNIYNLRQVAQKEYAEEYAKAHGIEDEGELNETLKKFFKQKNGKDKDETNKNNMTRKLDDIKSVFMYTRALIRAYISMKNGLESEPGKGVTKNNLKNINDKDYAFYNGFMTDMAEKNINLVKAKEVCKNYLEKCLDYCDDPAEKDTNNKDDYKDLRKCIRSVMEGNEWFYTDFQRVVEKITSSGGYSDEIFKKKKWLISEEGNTELNIQTKNIETNIAEEKRKRG